MRTLKQKAKEIENIRIRFMQLREEEKYDESITLEKKYLQERQELIASTEREIGEKKSISIKTLRKEVNKRPKPILYATGIRSLDAELVYDYEYGHSVGGFGLGNFVLIGGVKGAGKTSFVVRLLSGLSKTSAVAWMNFEMSDHKIIRLMNKLDANEDNIFYYDGNRDIESVTDEIKYLYQGGAKHILIDSMMKITAEGKKRGYETVSEVSNRLSELSSRLGINIYMINQVSQETEKGGGYYAKNGNDAEYDADYIFFMVKMPTGEKDPGGGVVYHNDQRLLVCTKNRDTERLFDIILRKSDLFGISPEVVEYENKGFSMTPIAKEIK